MYIVQPRNYTWEYVNDTQPPPSYEGDVYAYEGNEDGEFYEGAIVLDKITPLEDSTIHNTYYAWYKCLSDGTVGKKPSLERFYWSFLKSENQTAFLDKYINSRTFSQVDKPISIKLSQNYIDTIYCNNLTAKYVILEYDDITVTYDLKEDMSAFGDLNVGDILYQRAAMFTVPLTGDILDYTLTFTNGDKDTSDGVVYVGDVMIGYSLHLGNTAYPIDLSLSNISDINTDGLNDYDDPQQSYKDINYTIYTSVDKKDTIVRILELIKQKDCLYIPELGMKDVSLIAYGKFENAEFSTDSASNVTLDISVKAFI